MPARCCPFQVAVSVQIVDTLVLCARILGIEATMSHPFGDLLSQHLHRQHGLSQAKLAEGILQDPSIIAKMCKGSGSRAHRRASAWWRSSAGCAPRGAGDPAGSQCPAGRRRDVPPARR